MAELSSPAAVLEIGTAAPWVRKWSSLPWVRGPLWDGFWILSALWLAPIVLLLAHGYSNPESSPLDLLYFGLTALFWIGHRFSSTYLAYCTEAYRPLLREQPIRFIALPIFITAGCFALFLPADSALPWTREERLIGLAIIDYACVTYHFAAQHFGALSLYRSRADRGSCIQTRRFDRFFALTAGGVLVFVADILAGAVAYQDQWVDRWFPAWIVSAENGIRGGAMLALLAVTAVMLIAELRTPRWSLPRVLYIVGLAVMVGLALRPRSLFLFLVIWTSQHWILATGLASQTPSAESGSNDGYCAPILAQIECAAMGGRAFAHVVVACVPPYFRGGSKSRDRHLLRRSNIWCVCDAAPNVHLGARARRARICDGIHSLFARSKCLSNVGPASARGSIWPDWQCR